jgi:hypothetical protein
MEEWVDAAIFAVVAATYPVIFEAYTILRAPWKRPSW